MHYVGTTGLDVMTRHSDCTLQMLRLEHHAMGHKAVQLIPLDHDQDRTCSTELSQSHSSS
jgi:hypothetical protein